MTTCTCHAAITGIHGVACKMRGMAKKRGYSRDFTPAPQGHAKYLLDKIPVPLWRDVRAKAKKEGVSLRALILKLLSDWLNA